MKTKFKIDKTAVASIYNSCAKDLGWKTIAPEDVLSDRPEAQLLAQSKKRYQHLQEHLS